MARKPIPTQVKLMRGMHRQDRHGNPEAEPKGRMLTSIPEPPDTLGEVGRRKWHETISRMIDLGLAEDSYLDAVEVYASLYDDLEMCRQAIEAEGAFHMGLNGSMSQHPAVILKKDVLDKIRRYQAEFGFTPAGRTHVHAERTAAKGIQTRERA